MIPGLHFEGPVHLLWVMPLGLVLVLIRWYRLRAEQKNHFVRLAFFGEGLAWILLVLSLARPYLQWEKIEYRAPKIIMAMDISSSFNAGQSLGLSQAVKATWDHYHVAAKNSGYRIEKWIYGNTAQRITSLDGEEAFWNGATTENLNPSLINAPTRIQPLLDSLNQGLDDNPVAVLIFGDGRAVDIGKEAEAIHWPAPLYALPYLRGTRHEVQAERVDWQKKSNLPVLTLEWQSLNDAIRSARVKVQVGQSTLVDQVIDVHDAENFQRDTLTFSSQALEILRHHPPGYLILTPSVDAGWGNVPDNDTLELPALKETEGSLLCWEKPILNLDETEAIRLLASDSLEVTPHFVYQGCKGRIFFVHARPKGEATTPAAGPAKSITVLLQDKPFKGRLYGLNARLQYRAQAQSYFPAAWDRLRDLSAMPLRLPPFSDGCVLAVSPEQEVEKDSTQWGCLFSHDAITDRSENRFLVLPAIWNLAFHPDPDLMALQRVHDLLKGVINLSERENLDVHVTWAKPVLAEHEWVIRFGPLPQKKMGLNAELADLQRQRFSLLAQHEGEPPFPLEIVETAAGQFESKLRPMPGKWQLQLTEKGKNLWRDSVSVVSGQQIEQHRLGFDSPEWDRWEVLTGGGSLHFFSGNLSDTVFYKLPWERSTAHETATFRRTRIDFRLSLWFLGVILTLLAGSWTFRRLNRVP